MTRIAHRVSSAAVSHSRNPGPPEKDQLRAPENHRPHPAQGGRAQTPDHEEAVVPLLPGEAASVSGDPQPLPGGPAMWRSPLSIIHGVRYADRGMKSSEARGTPHPPKTWPRQPLEPDLTERAVLEHRMERHFPRSLPTEGLRGQRVLFFRQGTRENSAGTGGQAWASDCSPGAAVWTLPPRLCPCVRREGPVRGLPKAPSCGRQ